MPILVMAGIGVLFTAIIFAVAFSSFLTFVSAEFAKTFGPTYKDVAVNRCQLYDKGSSGIFNGTYSDGTKNWNNANFPDNRCTHSIILLLPDKTKPITDEVQCHGQYDKMVQHTRNANVEFCTTESLQVCQDALTLIHYDEFKKDVC